MKILFIGNSHTYFNDMPHMVDWLASQDGVKCQVAMMAQGGWTLAQHVASPATCFNIRYGHYDYVVLQEHSHPFADRDEYFRALRTLDEWTKQASAKTVIYATWAPKDKPELQPVMDDIHNEGVRRTGALLAPVGPTWQNNIAENPDKEMYFNDGEHASYWGSYHAARCIWNTIFTDLKAKK